MNNLISFVNAFLSYLLVAAVITVLIAIAIFIGVTLRKKKNVTVEYVEESEASEDSSDKVQA